MESIFRINFNDYAFLTQKRISEEKPDLIKQKNNYEKSRYLKCTCNPKLTEYIVEKRDHGNIYRMIKYFDYDGENIGTIFKKNGIATIVEILKEMHCNSKPCK